MDQLWFTVETLVACQCKLYSWSASQCCSACDVSIDQCIMAHYFSSVVELTVKHVCEYISIVSTGYTYIEYDR